MRNPQPLVIPNLALGAPHPNFFGAKSASYDRRSTSNEK